MGSRTSFVIVRIPRVSQNCETSMFAYLPSKLFLYLICTCCRRLWVLLMQNHAYMLKQSKESYQVPILTHTHIVYIWKFVYAQVSPTHSTFPCAK